MSRLLIATAALLACSVAGAVGRADVRYIQPESFVDAGVGVVDRERTQKLLTEHFEALARRLPDGQVLQVQVTQVDLAGEMDTLYFHRIRVLGQFPDAPRLSLRYELRQGEQVLARGEEDLSDLNYQAGWAHQRGGEALGYERRMLERWFQARFEAPRTAANAAPSVR